MRFLTLLLLLAATGCTVTEDRLEPNDDVAHATLLSLGEAREAIVVLENDDFYTTPVSEATTLRWHLVPIGREKEPRIGLVGKDGAAPDLQGSQACAAADAALPRSICEFDGSFILDAAIAAGASGVVVIHQPDLCVECFTPESSTYTISVRVAPDP